MSSTPRPHISAFLAGAAITKGMAVKIGADENHVVKSAAATDKHIGIAQNDAAASGDVVEVALPGGGGKALAQADIVAGMLLTSHTDGKLKKIATLSDRVIGMALSDAVAGDLMPVMVVVCQGTAVET